jgi:adenylate cyclase
MAVMAFSPPARSEQRGSPHLLTARFLDSELERRYRDDRLRFRLDAFKVIIPAAAAIWILFTALNALTIHDPSPPLLATRIAAIVLCALACTAAFVIKIGRWIEPVGFAMVAINIALLTCVLAFMSAVSLPYFPPLAIHMMLGAVSFAAGGVSFVEGVLLALATICSFLIAVLVLWPTSPLQIVFQFSWLITVVMFAGVGSYLLDRAQRTAWLQGIELSRAEGQIRSLLHTVLPPSIAVRKLAGEAPIADRFDEASLLFADVVDFTSLSGRLDSGQVVTMLSELFSRFDRIAARHGLEKIKTIGDCYMVAAGIPHPIPGHLKRLARAAFQMLEETDKVRAPDGSQIAVRIGMHTGAVTAGVIGEAKFIFDVWGDTVNMASRMESHGLAGQIQVTEAVRAALADDFDFAGPKMINVKGKGETAVWFLPLRQEQASNGAAS